MNAKNRPPTSRLPFGSSIQARLVTAMVLLTAGPLLLLGALITSRVGQLIEERLSEELRVEVETAAETLKVSLQGIRSDLLSLVPFIQRRLAPVMSPSRWQQLERELQQTLREQRVAYQLRFLDSSGQEVLGIDAAKGTLFPAPRQSLVYHGHHPYFAQAMRLTPGQVFRSPLALGPLPPQASAATRLVSRMVTPVTDSRGRVRGLLMIQIFAEALLKDLGPLKALPGIGIFLIDGSERYLVMKSKNGQAVFHVDNQQQLDRDLGFAPPSPVSVRAATVRQSARLLVALAPVRILPDRQWLLAKSYPKRAILADLARLRLTILALAMPLTLAVIWLAVFTARRFTRPIRELSGFAEAVAAGDYERPVSVTGRDELGQLAATLRAMGRSLAESRAQLLDWNRTLQEEVVRKIEALQESEEKYRQIFSAESDAIIIFDALTRQMVDANAAAEHLYGYSRQELLRLNVADISTEPAETDHRIREVLAGERQTIRLVHHRRRDGSLFPGEVSAGTFTLNGRLMLVAIVRDITERQKIETLKDEMLSAVSHEMRTPLTAMLGFVEYLLEHEVPPGEQREYMGIILKESERLKSLIDNLLTLQRLRAGFGRENFQPVTATTLLDDVAGTFVAPVSARRLRLDCPETLPPVLADPVQLEQALENLVSNALKYSPEDTAVTLGASPGKGGVTFWVRDQGQGIPETLQEQIFDRFFRIDFSNGRRVGGSGLGLPLVKEVARVHEGRAWVESRPGEGSLFCLFIPAAPSPADQKSRIAPT